MSQPAIPFKELLAIVEQQAGRVLFATLSGAHAYGFADENSDYDIRGAYVAPIREVLGIRAPRERVEDQRGDNDMVLYEMGKFCRLLCKPNANFLEQLYSPLVIVTSPEHERLKGLAQDVLCTRIARHYEGFWDQQRARYSEKPWKRLRQLLYGYRVLLTGIHLMRTGEVEANLLRLNEIRFSEGYPQTWVPLLVQAKQQGENEVSHHEAHSARDEQENLARLLREAASESKLPKEPRVDRINEFLVNLRLREAHNAYVQHTMKEQMMAYGNQSPTE